MIHPALPLLALLGLAGLLLGLRSAGGTRREAGLAWGCLALAATALLAPALAIPDGIPSPAATLAAVPPWQGTGDPAAGNSVLRDVTFQIQPWQLFARRELRAGRLPLWNPHQFSGAPFWANGQSAPLFPLHLLFDALPLILGFVLLPWLRLVVAGCGAWVLARELGLSRPAALLAALTFSLSGMLVSFLLFPMGNALALVPWVLWSVERIAGRVEAPSPAKRGGSGRGSFFSRSPPASNSSAATPRPAPTRRSSPASIFSSEGPMSGPGAGSWRAGGRRR